MNLSLANCRGQCYDGAAVMKGVCSGVSSRILAEQPKALYTHCYGHSLNLACQDMVREVKCVRDATFELSKLLKYSAKRTAEYKRLKQEIAPEEPGFQTMCPTRWTVRAASLKTIIQSCKIVWKALLRWPSTIMRCLQSAQESVLSFLPSNSCLALLLVDWSSSLLKTSASLCRKRECLQLKDST